MQATASEFVRVDSYNRGIVLLVPDNIVLDSGQNAGRMVFSKPSFTSIVTVTLMWNVMRAKVVI